MLSTREAPSESGARHPPSRVLVSLSWRSAHCAWTSTGTDTTRPSDGWTIPSHVVWKRSSGWFIGPPPGPYRSASGGSPEMESWGDAGRFARLASAFLVVLPFVG